MSAPNKRRRNNRPSKYRPRTDAQKQRRKALWEARADDRVVHQNQGLEDRLKVRLGELETALRELGRGGVHGRRHTRPLEDIADDAERLSVLKARVERLEALWSIDRRRRETRGKIIIGGALLAELIDEVSAGERALLTTILDVLDRRVDAVRDRLTVNDLLGHAPLPLRPGARLDESAADALRAAAEDIPDFDAMAHEAMADEPLLQPSDVDPDYADLDDVWRRQA